MRGDEKVKAVCNMLVVVAVLVFFGHGCRMLHEQDMKKMEIRSKEAK